MDEVSRTKLQLFVAEAEELMKYCITVNNFGGLMGIFRRLPEEEWQTHSTIRGMLSLFCRFIEERDGIALYVLGRNQQGQPKPSPLLKLTGMSESWYEIVRRTYKLFDDLLAIAPPKLVYHGEAITRWKVLETFLYGKFAHVHPAHRETLKQWQSIPDLYGELLLEFVSTVAFMSGELVPVVEASKHELSINA